jgi:hypothetical protein
MDLRHNRRDLQDAYFVVRSSFFSIQDFVREIAQHVAKFGAEASQKLDDFYTEGAHPPILYLILQCLHPLHRLGCSGPTNAIPSRCLASGMENHCAVHGTRLLRTELNIMHGEDVPKATAEYHRLRTTSATLESKLDHGLASSLRVLAIIQAIDRIEIAIDRALDGYDPDRRVWRFISARDFLVVVRDVTTWALSNFECFHARARRSSRCTLDGGSVAGETGNLHHR